MFMRVTSCCAAAAFAFLCAEVTAAQGSPAREDPLYVLTWDQAALREGFSAERLMGDVEVRGADGENLGSIQDLIIAGGGEVVAVIVAADKGLPRDAALRIPWGDVGFDTALRFVRVPVTRDNLRNFVVGRGGRPEDYAREWRATELLGNYVVLADGARYGAVDDLIVALNGRVEALVVTADTRQGRFAFPFSGDRVRRGADAYVLPYEPSTTAQVKPFDYGPFGIVSPHQRVPKLEAREATRR